MKFYWLKDAKSGGDTAAFRYTFTLTHDADVKLRHFGVSWYTVHLDGEYSGDGPYRFEPTHPQYSEIAVRLSAGRHVLAAEVRDDAVTTRMLRKMPPFFGAEMTADDGEISPAVKAARLDGVVLLRRINPQLGWSEERNLANIPDFVSPDFCDDGWDEPVEVFPQIGKPEKTDMPPVRRDVVPHSLIASGKLRCNFGYDGDDPPAGFFLRETVCDGEYDGVWFRYDLGRVRLAFVEAEIDAPRGAVMEIAFGETLAHRRVSPFITLSAGQSCNMDRYRLREGKNLVRGFVPHGGRYAEIHLLGVTDPSCLRSVSFYERNGLGEPTGAFECDDGKLSRIWQIGADTLRACTEDTVTDNPTRERGEWTGDVVSAGLEVCAAAYDDMRFIKRGLRHAAYCASDDGAVAGLCPGGVEYLSTYALQWVCACMKYYRATGDKELLRELFPVAERNMAYFDGHLGDGGLDKNLYWAFVDWGHVPNDGESDMAVNLMYLSALRSYADWAKTLGRRDCEDYAAERIERVRAAVEKYLSACRGDWRKIGLHSAALALGEGFFRGQEEKECVDYIEKHYLDCFPNNPDAPRLSSPDKNNPRLITPYFSHYIFPLLWERGEGDFVLGQYRACWGWLMTVDNTWAEVFDDRWSHCHAWSGCPTWQLTRYVLGLTPRFDIKPYCYEYSRKPCSLARVKGVVPIAGGGKIEVEHCDGKTCISSDRAVYILLGDKEYELAPQKPLRF